MMKRYLMLYAFILSTLTLLAHDDKVTGFLEADMVSFPGGNARCIVFTSRIKTSTIRPFR